MPLGAGMVPGGEGFTGDSGDGEGEVSCGDGSEVGSGDDGMEPVTNGDEGTVVPAHAYKMSLAHA